MDRTTRTEENPMTARDTLTAFVEDGIITAETADAMRLAEARTSGRCPTCGAGAGRWCVGIDAPAIHAERPAKAAVR
jgi:hypothetical protein